MTIIRTVFNDNLLPPDSYTVECGSRKARFPVDDKSAIGEWIMSVWREGDIAPAYVYYNINWDSDHVLFAKYELDSASIFEIILNGRKEEEA